MGVVICVLLGVLLRKFLAARSKVAEASEKDPNEKVREEPT